MVSDAAPPPEAVPPPESAPRVSVLLPTHDRADIVGLAIGSVLAQTMGDLELLVLGDGCTDDTAAVVTAFDDPRVRWFDLPKAPGFGYANRNRAMREARGELVAFMAHDDLLLPDHLERLAVTFVDPAVAWAHSRPAWVSREGVIAPLPVDLRLPEQRRYALTESNTIPAACVMYRRDVGEQVGGWPEDALRRGDRILWGRILDRAGEAGLAVVPHVTSLHFIADWRRAPSWGAHPFDSWLPTLRPGPDWPAALQVPVPPGATEQAAVWERMAQDPSGWTAALRAATPGAIDRLAWQGVHAIYARWTEPDVVKELERQVQELRTAAAASATSATRPDGGAAAAQGQRPVGPPPRASRARRILRRTAATPPALLVRSRAANPLFDAAWYRERYPDVRGLRHAGALGAWRHWRRHGWREGRSPNAVFDTRWYLARNPAVAEAGLDPLEHYLRWGAREGRDPAPGFDARWYRATNEDVRTSGIDPLLHYLRHGRAEGRQPHPPGH